VARSDDASIVDLVQAIKTGADYAMENKMHAAAVEFVTEVRRRLGLPDAGAKLTESYAKHTQQQMLLFLAWLQRRREALGGKVVRLCPVFSVRRQHVQLDCTTLLHVLSGMRLVPEHLMAKQGEATDWEGVLHQVAGMFEPPCPAKQKGKLQWWGSLSTDGVAASFVFADTMPVSKKGNKTVAAAATAAVTSSSRSKGTTAATTPLPPPHDLAVVGIDPGRCTIVHAATQVQGTRTLEWTLPRKRYRLESGLAQAQAKERRWDKDLIGGAWKQMNQQGRALRSSSM
jgi:hypothetical protein